MGKKISNIKTHRNYKKFRKTPTTLRSIWTSRINETEADIWSGLNGFCTNSAYTNLMAVRVPSRAKSLLLVKMKEQSMKRFPHIKLVNIDNE